MKVFNLTRSELLVEIGLTNGKCHSIYTSVKDNLKKKKKRPFYYSL